METISENYSVIGSDVSYDEIPLNAFSNETNNLTTSTHYDYYNYGAYYDYSSMEYLGEIKQVPSWETALKIALYTLITALALTGNLLIIVVVARNKRMQTTTNYFIVNLAVADLLVTCCCTWVRLVDDLTEGWVLGDFFCKVNSVAQVTSLVASIFSLVLIACDRFFGIVFAMKAHIIERSARYSIIIVWVCAIVVAAPLLIVRKTESVTWANHVEIWCDDDWPGAETEHAATGLKTISFPGRKAYYLTLTIALFFVPVMMMTAMYSLIIITVWFSRSPGERVSANEIKVQRRVKRKVVTMLIMILATFGLCWMPLQVCILYSEFRRDHLNQLPSWYSFLEFAAYTFAFCNSALNPIIYAGFNENFRKGFRALFGCYERKLYTAVRADSMINTSTTAMTSNVTTNMTKL